MSSTKSIEERLVKWLDNIARTLMLPEVVMDYASLGDSISYQTIGTQKVLKEYINGSAVKSVSFRLAMTFRGSDKSSAPSLEAIDSLSLLGSEVCKRVLSQIDETTTLQRASSSTPSLLWRTEDGDSAYGITINLEYKEA